MKLEEIRAALNAEVLAGEDMMDCEVISVCASDLMSDIMYYVKKQTVLLTGLINAHAIRTVDMLDIQCDCICRKQRPREIDMARKEHYYSGY